LTSIFECTYSPYEIVIVDDASDALTRERLAALAVSYARVTLLHNERRRHYSANNNVAAARAQGKYLCLLNNDTWVTPGWLAPLVRLLDTHPDIGVLGNRHLFPGTGKLHHCGIGFDREGHPVHLHPHGDPNMPAAMYQRDLQAVTFACVMIPARRYEELGGLDEAYENGYEDCDYCLRARHAGQRVTYTPASTIYHYGQSSPSRTEQNAANWQRFRARWQGKYDHDLERLTREDITYNENVCKRKTRRARGNEGIHFAMDFSKGNAFTWASTELIAALVHAGQTVTISPSLYLNRTIDHGRRRLLRRLMKKVPAATCHLRWSHYWPGYLNQPLSGDINAEFFCTNYRYRREGRRPDLWMRNVQLNHLRKLPITRFNFDALTELDVPASRCTLMQLGYAPEIDRLYPEGTPPRTRDTTHLLVFTNSHDLYRYGTDILVKALAEAFGPEDPVVVHIKDYGFGMERSLLHDWIEAQSRFPQIVWHREFLSKEQLVHFYATMDVLVAPFRGEGFGMKLVDAMALGLPVLMPRFGGPADFAIEGGYVPLSFDEVDVGDCYDRSNYYMGEGAYWCEVRTESLVEQLRAAVFGQNACREAGLRAREHVRRHFTWDAAARRLMNALQEWRQERLSVVAPRRGPHHLPLSVVIPTKDRPDALGRTLAGYRGQRLGADQFEVILVNDYGEPRTLEELVADHSAAMQINLIHNNGVPGPAGARNAGIERAKGEIVVITGDDIVPDREYLSAHLRMHREFTNMETAVVGRTLWHPDLEVTPFMELITDRSGHQFNYRNMRHRAVSPFDRFYTSNVSLKRAFLVEEEELFSTIYPYAAYEDIELAYRLHLRGMQLRYYESAKGYHHHPMTPKTFVNRQRKVGQMLALLAMQRPEFVPENHQHILRSLELARSRKQGPQLAGSQSGLAQPVLDGLLSAYLAMQALEADGRHAQGRPVVDRDMASLKRWSYLGSWPLWETINELALRMGMAEYWATSEEEAIWARDWVVVVSLPKHVGHTGLYHYLPFKLSTGLFPHSRLAYMFSQSLRRAPIFGMLVQKFENSEAGRQARDLASKILRRDE